MAQAAGPNFDQDFSISGIRKDQGSVLEGLAGGIEKIA